MGRKEKLLARFKEQPADFTWDELCTLLQGLGFEILSGSGSRYKFFRAETGCMISLHKPHPGNEVKRYAMRDVLVKLKEEGLV